MTSLDLPGDAPVPLGDAVSDTDRFDRAFERALRPLHRPGVVSAAEGKMALLLHQMGEFDRCFDTLQKCRCFGEARRRPLAVARIKCQLAKLAQDAGSSQQVAGVSIGTEEIVVELARLLEAPRWQAEIRIPFGRDPRGTVSRRLGGSKGTLIEPQGVLVRVRLAREIASGRRDLVRELRAQAPAGVTAFEVFVSRNGQAYAYTTSLRLANLYVVEGLR